MPRCRQAPPDWVRSILVAVPLCGMALFFSTCRRELSEKETQAITAELERAAHRAARRKAEVRVAHGSARAGSPPVERQPGIAREPSLPILWITLRDRSRADAVRQSLLRVGRERKLSGLPVEPPAGAIEKLEFRFRSRLTHIAVIEMARALNGSRPALAGTGPRVAIVIDDLGADRNSAETIFQIPYPLTVAVLPRQPHSAEVAERAYQKGLDVLLHLPMEPANSQAKREKVELRPGMAPAEVKRTMEEEIAAIPHVVGVNNHEGSRATADPALMSAVMGMLKQKKLFFVDSRTTPQTVAYDAAVRAQLPATFRTVFLDRTSPGAGASVAYSIGQLKQLEKQARATGWGLAIGHPHPGTLAALARYLPVLERRGFRIVYASELVQLPQLPRKAPASPPAKNTTSSSASRSR